jgi:hypothetical protein
MVRIEDRDKVGLDHLERSIDVARLRVVLNVACSSNSHIGIASHQKRMSIVATQRHVR